MATNNYVLQDWAASDVLTAARLAKPNQVMDRAGHFGLSLLPDGRFSGANIETTKRIAFPGSGMIDGCAWSISATDEETGAAQAGSSDTQLKDTANLTQADDYWIDAWLFAESGANNGEYRQVTAFDQGTATLTVASAFSSSFSAGDNYRVTFVAIKPDTLTNSSVNYVFGRRVTHATQGWTTEASGVVEFYASTSSTKQAGEILLGTITLDGSGTATAVDNDVSSVVDTCYAIDIRELRGTTAVTALAGGATTAVYVTHDAALLFGPFVTLSMDNANFTVTMLQHYEDDRFQVQFENTGAYSDSATLTWRRRVLVA